MIFDFFGQWNLKQAVLHHGLEHSLLPRIDFVSTLFQDIVNGQNFLDLLVMKVLDLFRDLHDDIGLIIKRIDFLNHWMENVRADGF